MNQILNLAENEGPEPLTLSQWAIVCNNAMEINGFNDTTGRYLNGTDPVAQIAAMSLIKLHMADMVEAVRKPNEYSLGAVIWALMKEILLLVWLGLPGYTERYLRRVKEWGKPVHGSWSQVVHRLVLTDTETAEGVQACHNHDVPNLAEENVDAIYRLMNLTGHWNQTHPEQVMDLDATLRWKHQKNLSRGYRHGGKRA